MLLFCRFESENSDHENYKITEKIKYNQLSSRSGENKLIACDSKLYQLINFDMGGIKYTILYSM